MYPAHTQLVAIWSSPSIGDQRATGCSVQFLGSLIIKRHRGAIKASLTSDMTIMFENFEFHFCHSNKVAVCVSGDVDTAEQGILFRAVSVDI